MTNRIVLFTRDLRTHDQPVLRAAHDGGGEVVCVFVLDEDVLVRRYAAPNRLAHLLDALGELRAALRDIGGDLVVRRGGLVEQLVDVAAATGAGEVHLARDGSRYARRRCAALRAAGLTVIEHDATGVIPVGALTTGAGGPYQVFSAYWRRWTASDPGRVVAAPEALTRPRIEPGRIPRLDELSSRPASPRLGPAGQRAASADAEQFLARRIDVADREAPAAEATSRLSAHLHLGTLSARELAVRVDTDDDAQQAFLRQLCWRDFAMQLFAAHPDLVEFELRPRGDPWRDDPQGLAAWRQGRTGYPLVDAGMRQLLAEGWMHNRVRMVAASFLSKHLRIDWRLGAWHFMDHLVDGDLAVNFTQWQWVAGTGTDPRPNRMLQPVTQSRRYDPHGTYLRRHLPELADLDDASIHEPWLAPGAEHRDYPAPIVEHREARARFLAERGRA